MRILSSLESGYKNPSIRGVSQMTDGFPREYRVFLLVPASYAVGAGYTVLHPSVRRFGVQPPLPDSSAPTMTSRQYSSDSPSMS